MERKVLFIRTDNNSFPDGCGEDVEVLDCRCINDFCSIVGDALVSDLKDENGEPYYRLINPVGRLLMDFKEIDEKTFNTITEDWYDILGNLLHKNKQNDVLTIKFPQEYVDWLTQNENPYYEQVGLELQKNKGVLELSFEDITDDIVASLSYKVSHTLQDRKGDISFVVFSNPIIRNSSFIVKRVKFDGIDFLHVDSWVVTDINEKNTMKIAGTDIILNIKNICFKMIKVEGGTLKHISGHCTTLNSYYIAETEVTQALWQAVMGNNPSFFKGQNRPVENVSWYDCQMFIDKLNILTGKIFRLPSADEWEFAARGGIKSMGYQYSGSDNLDSVAWHSGNSYGSTSAVGQKKPNELGLYDMNGNVDEWCNDSFLFQPTERVCRGGAYFENILPYHTRCLHADERFTYVGFRLAL